MLIFVNSRGANNNQSNPWSFPSIGKEYIARRRFDHQRNNTVVLPGGGRGGGGGFLFS